MNKKEVLEKYENSEDKILVANTLDKIQFVEKRNSIENTNFLSLHEISILENLMKKLKYNNYIFYGGYDSTVERKMLIIYPEKLEVIFEENKYDYNNLIQVISIVLPNELRGKYTHRNYLGAIIKLGVKREKIGDILVSLDGADIIVTKDIAKFLQTELNNLTRFNKSEITIKNIEEINITPPQIKKADIIVPSMRLDSIVSEVVKTSRAKANELILSERVFINNELVLKNSKLVKENDLITVRGKGRFKIGKILNTTKKGNLVLGVEIYI